MLIFGARLELNANTRQRWQNSRFSSRGGEETETFSLVEKGQGSRTLGNPEIIRMRRASFDRGDSLTSYGCQAHSTPVADIHSHLLLKTQTESVHAGVSLRSLQSMTIRSSKEHVC